MNKLTQLGPGMWQWDGVEEEHGFPIVGYIVKSDDSLFLIDPPHAPDLKDEITGLGRPYAIIITGAAHVRGTPHWAKEFQIPIASPASARDELREAGLYPEVVLTDGYEEQGWQVLHLSVDNYDEVALWNAEHGVLLVGDVLVLDESGNPALGAHLYASVPLDKLRPIVERLAALEPKLVLSGHLGVREDGAQILNQLLKAIPAS